MNRLTLIAKKELKDLFDQPAAYVLIVIFLAVCSYFYFKSAFLSEIASMGPLFEILPWVLMLFVPAITMRSLAAEKREGTLELLLTRPLMAWHVLAGKALGNFIFITLPLLVTLTIPATLTFGGNLDAGVIAAQYFGGLMMVLAFVSIGLFSSSVTQNQTIAFIISITINFFLLITGSSMVIATLPAPLANAANAISIQEHFNSITRGVIDLRDVIYFITIAAIFVLLAYVLLARDRLSKKGKTFQNIKLAVFCCAVGLLVVNFMVRNTMVRLDMTEGRIYSISKQSIELSRALQKPVKISVYASDQLPPEADLTFEDIKYTLRSIERQSDGKISLSIKNMDKDEKARFEANLAGIQPVNFNIIRKDEFQIKQGFLGLVIELGEKKEVIPFIESTSNFEYQLLSLINKVAQEKKVKIGYLTGHREKSLGSELGLFSGEASRYYEIEEFSMNTEKPKVPEKYRSVIIAGPQKWIDNSTQKAIGDFVKNGGSVFILMEGLEMDPQQYSVKRNMNATMKTFSKDLGVSANGDLLHDLRSNENVSMGQGQEGYTTSYPVWLRTLVPEQNQISQDLGSILLPWASSIELHKKNLKGVKIMNLYSTTPYTKSEKDKYTLSANNDTQIDTRSLKKYDTAVALSYPKGGRAVFISDSDFLSDGFSQNYPENLIFGLNSLDWLTQEKSFSAIRSKQTAPNRLLFNSDSSKNLAKYSNMVGAPILVAILGFVHLARRRLTSRLKYGGQKND